jgi:hypothetical protein
MHGNLTPINLEPPPGVNYRGRQTYQPWTAAELDALRTNYPSGGYKACKPHMPLRTDLSIHKKAQELGIKGPGPQDRQKWFTSPHIDDAIRRAYAEDPVRGMTTRLGRRLGRPPTWIVNRARQLGVTVPRMKPDNWSAAEVALLREHAYRTANAIARIFRRAGFKRSPNAIQLRLTRLRFDRTHEDLYNGTQLAALFGVRQQKISQWIANGWLKARGRGTTRDHDIHQVHRKDVRRFIIENVGAVDLRRVDKHWFVDLVANKSVGD